MFVIASWNGQYEADRAEKIAKWVKELGFTIQYSHNPGYGTWVPILNSGVRLYPSRDDFGYQYAVDHFRLDPYDELAVEEFTAKIVGYYNKGSQAVKDSMIMVLLDTEGIGAPPTMLPEAFNDPQQQVAINRILTAARTDGVIGSMEDMPFFNYGVSNVEPRANPQGQPCMIANDRGEFSADHAVFRFADWWWGRGGYGKLYRRLKDELQALNPKMRFCTDPTVGNLAHWSIPPWLGKSAGMDFLQNWYMSSGYEERFPLMAMASAMVQRTSGLPVVQGCQLPINGMPSGLYPVSSDVLFLDHVLSLLSDLKNGCDDPDTPWGLQHWGISRFMPFHTAADFNYRDNSVRQMELQPENAAVLTEGMDKTKDFLDKYLHVFENGKPEEDRVGVLLTRGAYLLAFGPEWWYWHHKHCAYVYPLIMASIPFKFVFEDEPLDKFELLLVPKGSRITDTVCQKIRDCGVQVSGDIPRAAREGMNYVEEPTVNEVGNWPWGGQGTYPRLHPWWPKSEVTNMDIGHWRYMTPDENWRWISARAETYKKWFTEVLGGLEIDCDNTQVIVRTWRLDNKRYIFAVNHNLSLIPSDHDLLEHVDPTEAIITINGKEHSLSFNGAEVQTIIVEDTVGDKTPKFHIGGKFEDETLSLTGRYGPISSGDNEEYVYLIKIQDRWEMVAKEAYDAHPEDSKFSAYFDRKILDDDEVLHFIIHKNDVAEPEAQIYSYQGWMVSQHISSICGQQIGETEGEGIFILGFPPPYIIPEEPDAVQIGFDAEVRIVVEPFGYKEDDGKDKEDEENED